MRIVVHPLPPPTIGVRPVVPLNATVHLPLEPGWTLYPNRPDDPMLSCYLRSDKLWACAVEFADDPDASF